MALSEAPAFVGKIIVTSANNLVLFTEATVLKTATIAVGEYYPDDLMTAVQAGMDAASGGNTYSLTWNAGSSYIGIERATGSTDFSPATNLAGSNLWTGGGTDTSGNTWANGQNGPHYLGFEKTSSVTEGAGFTSPSCIGGMWIPNMTPVSDTLNEINSPNTIESRALDGSSVVYDFTDWQTSNNTNFWATTSFGANHDPTFAPKQQTRTLGFDFISPTARGGFITNFWGPWAKTGGTFRYYPTPLTDSSFYIEYRLTGDSLRTSTFTDRRVQYAYYSGTVAMARV